jgi:hypothetical protein
VLVRLGNAPVVLADDFVVTLEVITAKLGLLGSIFPRGNKLDAHVEFVEVGTTLVRLAEGGVVVEGAALLPHTPG